MIKDFKNVLLASAVASTLFAAAAQADVRLVVGGYIDAQVGFRSEDNKYEYLNLIFQDSEIGTADDLQAMEDKRRGEAIVHDSTLSFLVTGHTDAIFNGLNYGGLIVLEADTSSSKYHLPYLEVVRGSVEAEVDEPGLIFPLSRINIPGSSSGSGYRDFPYNTNRNAREVMMFFEGMFGRVEVGNTYGATKKMQVDAGTVAAGNGGIHGDSGLWIHLAPTFGNFRTPDFYTNRMAFYHVDDLFLPVLMPGSSSIALPYSTEMATAGKISYYSPNFNGLQFGVSYTRDTDITGTVANTSVITENASPHGFGFENVFEGGFMYDGNFSGFNFQFSLLGQTGNAKAPSGNLFASDRLSRSTSPTASVPTYEDLQGFEVGFATEFMGIGFAASYGHHDGLLSTLKENEYYTLGLGYDYGPWSFSVNYMDSKQESNAFVDASGAFVTREAEFSNLVFDISYTCQGLMPYLSVAVFEAVRPEYFDQGEQKNDGAIVLLGTKLSF